MAINTTLASLSKTAALNGPDGNTDPPSSLDDGLRYALSFIAQLREGEGYTVALGMPVKTGENSTGGITIGYRTSLSKFTISDGATVYAKWPIDVSGKADTAGLADSATLAADSSKLGGVAAAGYVRGAAAFAYVATYTSGNDYVYWTVNGAAKFAYTGWAAVEGRPTNLSQFTNGPGFQTASDLSNYAVQRQDSVLTLGNQGAGLLRVNLNGVGLVGWPVSPSDARLKTDVAPTREDSLYKISQIDFRQFRFRTDVTEAPIDDGRLHRLGVIAQELEMLDPEWVIDGGTWKSPDQQVLLYAALHAIQQLRARMVQLEAHW